MTANRAPLAAIREITFAWSGLPAARVLPQSPNTANLKGVLDPAGTWVVKTGLASVPSRSRLALPKNSR